MKFPPFTNKTTLLISTLCISALVGCGGGGGGGASSNGSAGLTLPATEAAACANTPAFVFTSPTAVGTTYSPATITAGAVVTDFKIENTGTSAQTNVPFTFGQVFAAGDLLTNQKLAGKLSNNSLIPLQVDVKATHGDGSVRHAVISGIAPSVPTGAPQTIQLVKATMSAPSGTTPTPTQLINSGLTASVNIM
ncbi:MAG: RIFT barrel domain-containing protein, partial [Burkholderiaceae bacterium]